MSKYIKLKVDNEFNQKKADYIKRTLTEDSLVDGEFPAVKCWITNSRTSNNEPRFFQKPAARVTFELFRQEVSEGQAVTRDKNVCTNKHCINPFHFTLIEHVISDANRKAVSKANDEMITVYWTADIPDEGDGEIEAFSTGRVNKVDYPFLRNIGLVCRPNSASGKLIKSYLDFKRQVVEVLENRKGTVINGNAMFDEVIKHVSNIKYEDDALEYLAESKPISDSHDGDIVEFCRGCGVSEKNIWRGK